MNAVHASLAACAAFWLPLPSQALEVTLCKEDVQAPSGDNLVNLQTALQAGGAITFNCGGPATIYLRRTYVIQRDTSIDGGGKVTLDGNHNWFGMFQGAANTISFNVRDVHIVNAGRFARPGDIGRAHGSFIGGKFAAVQLVSVTVESSVWPVWLVTGGLQVNESRFSNNDGAVVTGTNIEVVNHSVFSNNRRGSISSSAGTVTIADSQFLSNTGPARVSGGTLKVIRSNFTGNVGDANGGALRIGSNASIEESDFVNNRSVNGGALFVEGNTATVSLRALKFHDNVASDAGGAISFEKSQLPVMLEITHTTFQDNLAKLGGAVSLERAFNSHLSLNGGAVAFVRNRASDSGGALYAPSASIQLNRGVFIGNQAGNAGGAIFAFEQNNSTVTLANSLVVRNSAPKGAAFFGNRARFINSTVADNRGVSIWPQALPVGPTLSTTPLSLQFVNSIVASTGNAPCGSAPPSVPYVGGNNLQYPGTSCGVGFAVADPYLGSYYIPFFWSSALGAGNDAVCSAKPINRKDVYNTRRPVGNRSCSIGAVENSVEHLIWRWRPRESGFTFSM